MLPEILLFGKAGSGKDTVAEFITKHVEGSICIAMADPMKRFAQATFGFSTETLWGPSSARNAMDPRFTLTKLNEHGGWAEKYAMSEAWETAFKKTYRHGPGFPATWDWIESVLPGRTPETAVGMLQKWFGKLMDLAYEQGGLSARTMLQTLGTEWGRHLDQDMWVKYAQRTQRKLLSGGYTYDKTAGLVDAPGARFDLAIVTDGRFRNECLGFKAAGATVIRVTNPAKKDAGLQAGVKGHASEAEQDTIPDSWFDAIINNDKALGFDHIDRTVESVMDNLLTVTEFA